MSAPAARLIYHPRREFRRFGSTAVYFDSTSGNQDPYVWNDVFLHSYCHITQFHAEVGDINVWVSGDRFPEFSSLYCDLVFVVARTCPWTDANDLSRHDPMVDSDEAWADHYRWYPQHPLKRRSRFTLKADPDRSFQPQTGSGDLIDIVPCLREHGITLDSLRAGLRAGTGSQPMTIPVPVAKAITQALSCSHPTLRGPDLRKIRLRNPELQSPAWDAGPSADGVTQASPHSTRCGY